MAYNHPIGSIYHLYTTYILPSGGLYNPYHLLGEPETTIDGSRGNFLQLLRLTWNLGFDTDFFVQKMVSKKTWRKTYACFLVGGFNRCEKY